MNSALHFIDANVPMYAVGAEHPLKRPCVAILDAIADGSLVATTSVEVLQEILHRYTALGQRERAVEIVRLFLEVIPAPLPVTLPDLLLAMDLHLRHPTLQARDVIHLAVMDTHGITRIITADQHFDHVPGITRVDPVDWAASPPAAQRT
ncbi:MAG: type II toxin-antitoxin system VapC family toxin [Dehalococcoidia bacterium]